MQNMNIMREENINLNQIFFTFCSTFLWILAVVNNLQGGLWYHDEIETLRAIWTSDLFQIKYY